jgi:hypothetical protein
MPPRYDQKPEHQEPTAKRTPTPETPVTEAIQRALAHPGPQTLTPEVLNVLRQSHGNAFVQRLIQRSPASPSAPTSQSLDSFLDSIATARQARPPITSIAPEIQRQAAPSETETPGKQEALSGPHVNLVFSTGAPTDPKPGPRSHLLQRMTVTVTLDKKQSPSIIKGMSVSSRPGTGYAHGQGSHNTAWITFEDMILLRIQNKNMQDAADGLKACYDELQDLPGAEIDNDNYKYAKEEARVSIALLKSDKSDDSGTKALLVDAIEKMLTMRNKMPLSSTSDGSKIVGNEGWHTILLDWERKVRRDVDITGDKNYPYRFQIFWAMFDYQPTASVSNEVIENVVTQHVLSMQATYETLVSKKGHLNMNDAMKYLVADKAGMWTRLSARITGKTKEYDDPNEKKKAVLKTLSKIEFNYG